MLQQWTTDHLLRLRLKDNMLPLGWQYLEHWRNNTLVLYIATLLDKLMPWMTGLLQLPAGCHCGLVHCNQLVRSSPRDINEMQAESHACANTCQHQIYFNIRSFHITAIRWCRESCYYVHSHALRICIDSHAAANGWNQVSNGKIYLIPMTEIA